MVVVVVSAVVVVVIVILTSSVITIVFVDPNLARSSTRADSAWALSTWCSASLSSGASTCTLVLPRKFLAVSNEQDDREGVKPSGDVGRGAAEARALHESFPRHPGRRPTARHGARGRCRKGEHRMAQ